MKRAAALFAAAWAALPSSAAAASDPFALYRAGGGAPVLEAYRAAASTPSADASADYALALEDAGRGAEAVSLWAAASALAPDDPFLWNQRGWSALAAGDAAAAAQAFASAVRVSSGAPAGAEAQLGLGLAQADRGKRAPAIAALQAAAARSGSLLPAASHELARAAMEMGRPADSIALFSMSLTGDPRQPDALREAARAYAALGKPREAWNAWRVAADYDPEEPETRRGLEEAASRLPHSPEGQLAVARRMARPLLRAGAPPRASVQIRVALFAAADGSPRELRKILLMTSAKSRLETEDPGSEAAEIPAGSPWEAVFSTTTRKIEFRDPSGRVLRTSAQPILLSAPGGSVLLKSAEPFDARGLDVRDRELRGAIELIPGAAGIRLVNRVGVEQYIPAALNQELGSEAPLEALEALAVVLRSRALAALKAHSDGASFCDSRHCRIYFGLTQESAAASRAARLTAGQTIAAAPAELEYHPSCGWATAEGLQDRAAPSAPPASPSQLERLLHQPPDPAHYDGAAERAAGASVRWTLILRAEDLQKRLDRLQPVGEIRTVRVAARGDNLRVLALEIVGSRGRARLEGDAQIAAFLAPGALRSSLFTLQPLARGNALGRLLVWGAGTGSGHGLCLAGAIGQARLGRRHEEILSHYFPKPAAP